MANPKRAMASMRRIDAIRPIDGADRIEVAQIGGWSVVVGKDDGLKEGDLVVFFEVDTFLPTDDSRYSWLAKRGVKLMIVNGATMRGHVLRTRRIRGQWSQGLVMRPQDVLPESIPEYAYERMWERKANLTSLCGVREYEPILMLEQGNVSILRVYDPWVGPKADAERIQNVSEEVFALAKRSRYFVSVKVDGTSMTMLNDQRYNKVRMFTRNNEIRCDKGFGRQVYEQAESQGIVGFLNRNPGITLQMEACGPKINGNRLGLKAMRLYVFSAWDTEGCRYIDPYELYESVDGKAHHKIGPNSMAPKLPSLLLSDFATTTDLIEHVDGLRGHVTNRLDEGIVIHLIDHGSLSNYEWVAVGNALGPQRQIKVISREYLLKAKD